MQYYHHILHVVLTLVEVITSYNKYTVHVDKKCMKYIKTKQAESSLGRSLET